LSSLCFFLFISVGEVGASVRSKRAYHLKQAKKLGKQLADAPLSKLSSRATLKITRQLAETTKVQFDYKSDRDSEGWPR
jgi:hypothetical protein